MNEEKGGRKVRKTGSTKVMKKPGAVSPKSEEENNYAPDNYRDDIPNSDIKSKSELNKSDIEHPTSEIKTMEVHHHPEVEKKTFKQYVLEGLMIFLAVFMGFIAENIRERIADHEREQQYMQSLVRDLALDTAALKAGFPAKEKRIEAIDSVFQFFESHTEPKTIPFNIYRNIRRTSWDRTYARNTGTIDQLKNAGGLRLIRKQDVRDSLATYDWLWERLNYYKDAYVASQQVEYNIIEKMLDAHDLIKSYRLDHSGSSLYPTLSNSSIVRIDTINLNDYLNFLYRQKVTTIQDEQRYKQLERKAELLIKMIKKEYDLE